MDLNQYLPPRVAVIELHGMIGPRVRAHEFTALLRQVALNPRYRAVVIDIDSPGGSAPASEDIYLATRKLARRKPVAAAIRGVGASGSYMVACAADRIISLPSAIVGSIGVISLHPVVMDLFDKLGVEMAVSKTGRFKDMGSPFREATDEERAKEQKLLDAMHDRFIEIVAEGRANLDADRVAELATGEIFLGRQALEHGLVDELGSLDDAVDWVADRAAIPPKTVTLHPKRSLVQTLLSRSATAFVDVLSVAIAERSYERALGLPPR